MTFLHNKLSDWSHHYNRWHDHPDRDHHHWLIAVFVMVAGMFSVASTHHVVIRDGSLAVSANVVYAQQQCQVSSIGQVPITDLGIGTYLGQQGGLYPGGSNTIPVDHRQLGEAIAATIQPINGKIGMISIGVSNTRNIFVGDSNDETSIAYTNSFKAQADADTFKNTDLVIVSGAQGGNAIDEWNAGAPFSEVEIRLAAAGLTPDQVQVAWIYIPDRGQSASFPDDQAKAQGGYESKLETLIKNAKSNYPNLKIAYVSSRGYGGYSAKATSNVDLNISGQNYAYQSAWGVKWVIENQINGSNPSLNPDPDGNPATADGQVPWLAWGPYFWSDGITPNLSAPYAIANGISWQCPSHYTGDGLHPDNDGVKQVADMLLNQMKTDSTACAWFNENGCGTQSPSGDYSLRFFGNRDGAIDMDRVKIKIDAPEVPADIGNTDFTFEFWMKGQANNNTDYDPSFTCGTGNDWIKGRIIFDRDRYNQGRNYGIATYNPNGNAGFIAFGVMDANFNAHTLCGGTNVLDNSWHHVAVQYTQNGQMTIYVDGVQDGQANGPAADISYPNGATPCGTCCNGGSCNISDPYLVIGAEKHSVQPNGFSGFIDEVHLSNTLRYTSNFTRPNGEFDPDNNTVALYHLNEGSGNAVNDVPWAQGGPSNGVLNVGGNPAGPIWSTDTPPFSSGPTPPPPGPTPPPSNNLPPSAPTFTYTGPTPGTTPPPGSGGVVNAASGSRADIQAAVDSASVGDTVVIPAGTFDFDGQVTIPAGINLRGSGQTQTTLSKTDSGNTNAMIRYDCSTKHPFEFSDITLEGIDTVSQPLVTDTGLSIGIANSTNSNGCEVFRVHSSEFRSFGRAGIAIWGGNKGVIDNSDFINNYNQPVTGLNLGYGIEIYGNADWPTFEIGTENAIFVENNVFDGNRHGVTSNNGSHYVFRYNVINNNYTEAAPIDAHGKTAWPTGSRSFEIYENTISNTIKNNAAIWVRGGDGVIYDNNFNGPLSNSILLSNDEGGDSCPAGGCKYKTTGLYIWNNNYQGTQVRDTHVIPNAGYVGDPLKISVRHPNVLLASSGCSDPAADYYDDNCRIGNYTAYTYPHPYVTGGLAAMYTDSVLAQADRHVLGAQDVAEQAAKDAAAEALRRVQLIRNLVFSFLASTTGLSSLLFMIVRGGFFV